MAVTVGLYATVVCCVMLISNSVSGDVNNINSVRSRYKRQTVSYDQELQSQTFPEDSDANTTVLFDFNSVNIDGQAAANFRYKVVLNQDSKPPKGSIFRIDDQQLQVKFAEGLSDDDHKENFDYEKFPFVVIIVEAVAISDVDESDKKVIKLTIPLSDVNDEPPELKNKPVPYLAAIPADAKEEDTVYELMAEDPDSSADLSYAIEQTPGNPDVYRLFRMDTIVEGTGNDRKFVGHIKVASNQGFELGRQYVIPVSVTDRNGVLPQVVIANVEVLVGPRAPQFYETKYEGSIFEKESTNNLVYTKDVGTGSNELIVKVRSFQKGNLPKTFKIIEDNSQESKRFRIDDNGHIFNKERLDHDIAIEQRPPIFKLHIMVIETLTDGTQLDNTVPLEITVKDENDNKPQFQLTQYLATIPEDTPIGSTILRSILAEDNDSGKNAEITYEVDNRYFDIQKDVRDGVPYGAIYVKDKLDFDAEPGPIYRFSVKVKDGGTPPKSSVVDVSITTSNVNDQDPQIQKQDSLVLRDGIDVSKKPYFLTRLRAQDGDGDDVKFYLSDNGNKVEKFDIFKITPESGVLEVFKPVPQGIDSYLLEVIAEDDGACCTPRTQRTDDITFLVEIVDSINQKPTFDDCLSYTEKASLEEESAAGTPIITVHANDNGRGLNGIVRYTIVSPKPSSPDAPFQINTTSGEITVKSVVDREALGANFIQVTVKATDEGESPQESWCTFRVSIKDINDNKPMFKSEGYSQEVSTNTQTNRQVLRVVAVDRDIGPNAELEFSLEEDGDGVFGIHETSGVIFLKSAFKGVEEYTLKVKAEDKGDPRLSGNVDVKIKFTSDKAIEPPQFTDSKRTFAVNETAPIQDTKIGEFTCISKDEDNSRVSFFLVAENGELASYKVGKFLIESDGNRVMLYLAESLDYETETSHIVTLRCQNRGGLTLYEQIELTVNVVDQNDEVPTFPGWIDDGVYRASVMEKLDPGAIVIEDIQATDSDVSAKFNQVQYGISPDSFEGVEKKFAIETKNGKAIIKTLEQFDREDIDNYVLTVTVNDKVASDIPTQKYPGEPNSATVDVIVTIEDVNDNPMVFKQTQYNHSVKETANLGFVIFAVTADDPDEVDQGRLSYTFDNNDIPFDIRDQTGDIFVTGKLDYESPNKEYRLKLVSRDNAGVFTAETEVVITVTDENDNIPIFNQPVYEVRNKVTEEDLSINRTHKMPLVQVKATDKDISRTTQIRYKLLGEGTEPGPNQLFEIDSDSGEIYLIAVLDRDKPYGKAEYIFTVEAEDEETDPQKGYANVKVFPKDINDNEPVFDRDSLTDSLYENSPQGSFVAQVKASDADIGVNADLIYDIIKSPATADDSKTNYFRITEEGIIYSQVDKKYLDRETMPELEVLVKATDKGDRPLSSTATLTIFLLDQNDNPPRFAQKVYEHEISENTKSGFILDVQADDDDIDENARLTFSIQKNAHFKITTNTEKNKGFISIQTPVDYEIPSQRSFSLDIFVNDKDFEDNAIVKITVKDFNDEAPVFVDAFKTVDIKEGESAGQEVETFYATDKDSGINSELSYTIDRQSDPRREFYIEPDTGVVRTRKSLDRETQEVMEITILAIDKGEPQQTGRATLKVNVLDINDNYPIFKEDYRPVVMENGGDNSGFKYTLPLEVYAKDLDGPQNGPPFGFELPSCNDLVACQKFSLEFVDDGVDGHAVVSTKDGVIFDREEQKYYELPIVTWDRREFGDGQTGTNTLTIVIGDENDNKHSPGHQDVSVFNYKGTFGPLVIGRVYVVDKDDWDLPDKSFNYISPASLSNYFSVDTETGDITMKKGVKANEGKDAYTFSVSVRDEKHKLTVVSTVSVTVRDLTEEAVSNSGGVRFSGITASEFIIEVDVATGEKKESLYTGFRKLLAEKLGYPLDNVEIVSLRDGDGYLEVRYSAHGSPYLSSAEMDNVVLMNQEEVEKLGLKVDEVPIDECQDEIFEGGCFNKLTITGKPVTINSNGTSYVGVEAYLVATQGCEADQFPPTNECTGDYCHNGGECFKNDWGSLECRNCPPGYTGSRCQERRHSFDGNSVAMYKTLTQCEESQTSIEFITLERNGVILYNGPLRKTGKTSDFIILMLKEGYPHLRIDHGTGVENLSLDGIDKNGKRLLEELSDGRWHQIDINRNGKEVSMVVDRCYAAETNLQRIEDDRACRVTKETPGVNMYLNVNSLLQLGGVRLMEADLPHLKELTLSGFDGCLRNLIHNKQLYDLHYKVIDGVKTGENGCPREDKYCRNADGTPKCGKNGECESTLKGHVTCTCHNGYWGKVCDKKATVGSYKKGESGYYLWKMKDSFFNTHDLVRNRGIHVKMMFRTRRTQGALLVLEDTTVSSSTQQIRLTLDEGRVLLTYNLGDGEKKLKLASQANNGEWHSVTMERNGTEFHLRMDNGEGQNYAYTLGSSDGKERVTFRVNRRVFSGGYKPSNDDLAGTCIQDVRINNGYFAMTREEGTDEDSVATVEEWVVEEGCERDDCKPDTCLHKPNSFCYPLWEAFDCRCKKGFYGPNCESECNPNPCFNNVTCNNGKDGIFCTCPPRWRGRLCDELGPEEVTSADMSDTALIAIIVSIILVILILLLILCLYFKLCRNGEEGEKYILEVDPEDDIRENVMNYDEEGAGEKDQDAFDISRLQFNNEVFNRPYDPDQRRDVPLRNAPGDKPDVGNFIDDRMRDADHDDGAPPHDSVREFNFEGGDSDAGSLSSLNTSSSDRSQDYDYLNEWGPKFSKLADMYGAGQDLPSS